MGVEELIRLLKVRPFEPFRIHVSDGSIYDIRHPYQAMPRRTAVWITVPTTLERVVDEPDIVAMIHITRVTPLPATSNATNGEGR